MELIRYLWNTGNTGNTGEYREYQGENQAVEMKSLFFLFCALALGFSLVCWAQDATVPAKPNPQQAAKPAAPKGSVVIGCLSGPDPDGKFELRSMSHRTGLEVVGPDGLKEDAGSKVKLTGSWEPIPELQGKPGVETRRFKVTEVEVLAAKCTAPIEQTPVSKQKQQQQQQKKKAPAPSNP